MWHLGALRAISGASEAGFRRSTMDWSSSQDDDGLESMSTAHSAGTNAESTVVVDPVSQIPAPHPSFRRETVEKTEVLQGRRIDQLRAEVNRRKKTHARKQQKRLLLWAAAGAGAVSLGAVLAGVAFAPGEQGFAAVTEAEPEPESVRSFLASEGPKETEAPQEQPTEPAGAIQVEQQEATEGALAVDAGLSLNDLPGEELPSEESDELAPSNADSGAALSLDDLPAE